VLHAPGELFEALELERRAHWTHADELLAILVQKLDELTNLFERANFKDAKIRRPFRYPRPSEQNTKRKGSTPEQIRKFFRGH